MLSASGNRLGNTDSYTVLACRFATWCPEIEFQSKSFSVCLQLSEVLVGEDFGELLRLPVLGPVAVTWGSVAKAKEPSLHQLPLNVIITLQPDHQALNLVLNSRFSWKLVTSSEVKAFPTPIRS